MSYIQLLLNFYMLHGRYYLLPLSTHSEVYKGLGVAGGLTLHDYVVVLIESIFDGECVFIGEITVYGEDLDIRAFIPVNL